MLNINQNKAMKDLIQQAKRLAERSKAGYCEYDKKAMCIAIGQERMGPQIKSMMKSYCEDAGLLMCDSGNKVVFLLVNGLVAKEVVDYVTRKSIR